MTSPSEDGQGLVRFSVESDGEDVTERLPLLSMTVQRAANKVPAARLVLRDGDMPNRAFPLCDDTLFKPGAVLSLGAGYGKQHTPLFQGVVMSQALRIDDDNRASLVVECRDKAVAMTVGRRNAHHVDQTDSAVIQGLVGRHQLSADVEATAFEHPVLAQHFSTDWDFMLARAEANGQLVAVHDGKVSVRQPQADGEPVLTVEYGRDLIEFEAELDARSQLAEAQGFTWDPANQAVLQGSSAKPAALARLGDLDSATLARVIGLESFVLQAGAPQSRDSLNAWAKAQQLKAGLARVKGRMRFQGHAAPRVGSLIELKGVGERFSGRVFVSAVDHEVANGNWLTEVRFGLSPQWFTAQPDVAAPAAGGLLPPVAGLQVGVVLKLDACPDGEPKIQVKVPVLQAETEGIWARLAKPFASQSFGLFFLPEVGDEVLLGYFNDDPSHPVVLGSLYSSKRKPPYELEAANDIKAIVTRSRHRIEFDEKDKIVTITTPGNNKVVLDDKDKSILLSDMNGNTVRLGTAGIALDSPKDITCTAKGGITLDAAGAVTLRAKADVKAQGMNVECQGQVGFKASGAASAELSASGQTTVRGAMVMIN